MKATRRGFMAALGIGAAAGPAAAKTIAPTIGGGYGMNAGMGLAHGLVDYAQPAPPWTARGLTEIAWKALHQKLTELEDLRRHRYERRIEGLDPDLWAMRAMSLPARMALQNKRDRELDAQIAYASGDVFGHPNKVWQ